MKNKSYFIDLRKDQSHGALDHLPPGVSPQEFLDYIIEEWWKISAFCYKYYRKYGRGFFLIDWDNSCCKTFNLHPRKGLKVCAWVSAELARQLVQESFIDQKIMTMLENYTPKTTLILAIAWGGDKDNSPSVTYKTLAIPDSTPYDNYNKYKNCLCEFE